MASKRSRLRSRFRLVHGRNWSKKPALVKKFESLMSSLRGKSTAKAPAPLSGRMYALAKKHSKYVR